ncbi:hypothetical protein LCGC14_0341310 [marine sediment metagenome]|uniref:Zona occludens toxin N-terminal domain-containing protein n=1 Tax=marine sediment metagenome TaxID=412755 RepID=A0A0F9TJB2_9ZZZZ
MTMLATRPLNAEPFAAAKVRIIEGEQGSGKSITGVAKIVDAYHYDCVRIFCAEHNIRCIVKAYDPKTMIVKIKQNGNLKLFKIPSYYKLHSPMRIFCNFHLYGIPYVYCNSFKQILGWLKQGIINNGKLVIDEYYIGANARESMSALGRELEKQSFQYRKMQLEVTFITPMARLIDWTARIIPTERIACEYDEKTGYVTLTIKKKGRKGSREVTFDSKPYRRYYWTNERINA